MNKKELVMDTADRCEMSPRVIRQALDGILHTIVQAVDKGERVSITGFGSFERVVRAPRVARDPQTGGRVHVATTVRARFRPGARFGDVLNGRHTLPEKGVAKLKAQNATNRSKSTVPSATDR